MTLFRRTVAWSPLVIVSRSNQFLDLEIVTAANWCPISTLTSLVRRNGPWYPVSRWRSRYDRVSRVPTYQTGHRAKLESDRADGAWYSTTALPSGRDRPLSLCVLRRHGSGPKTQWTGEWRPPSQASASSWRTPVMRSFTLSAANGCRAKKCANA